MYTIMHFFPGKSLRIFALFILLAPAASAQSILDTKVSIQSGPVSLYQLLKLLKEKTDINFIYNASEAAASKKISVDVADYPLKKILDKYLPDIKFTYEVSGKNILILKNDGKPSATADSSTHSSGGLPDKPAVITGRVTDEKNLPLALVTVQEKQSGTTVLTNESGQFEIAVKSKRPVLVFSHIGYEPVEEAVGSRRSVNVQLTLQNNKELEKVVVVGYGTQKKSSITGAVSSIGTDALADKPIQSFDQALVGKAPGVQGYIPSSVLNAPAVIRIRGTNSISLSSSPLYVIDGVPIVSGQLSPEANVTNNPLSTINPSDIESIDVLKDAASTSIYGSRAAAGVILITTKKGRRGKARVEYDGWVGAARAVRLPKLLDAQQYMDIKNEAVLNLKNLSGNANNPNVPSAEFFPEYIDGKLVNTNWYDVVYHTGVSQNHNINVSGADSTFRYFFSAGYGDQRGFIKKDIFKNIGVRANLEGQVTRWFKLSGGVNYSRTINASPATGGLPGNAQWLTNTGRLATALAPNVPVYNADGSYNISPTYLGSGNNLVSFGLYNPQPILDLDHYNSTSDHVLANISGEVNLLKGLYFKAFYAIDYNKIENDDFENNIQGPGHLLGGDATNIAVNVTNWDWTNTLNYSKTFNRHNIALLAGYDVQSFTQSQWQAVASQVSDPFYSNYYAGSGAFGAINFGGNYAVKGAYLYQWAFLSSFFRATYNFDQKYFITVNYRRDGNSALGADKKYGNFGGVSAAWALSEENFYKKSDISNVINNIKIRASIGKVGNGNVPNHYASLNLYSSGLYGAASTWNFSQAGNSDLAWETSIQSNIGVDISFLKNRLQLQVDAFNNDVNNLILNAPQTSSKGVPGTIPLNVGSLYNRGIELGVSALIISSGKFSWNASFNFTAIKNRVTALTDGNTPIVTTSGNASETNNITEVGYSVGSLYGAKTTGINPDNGQRIFVNGSGKLVQYTFAAPAGTSNWTYLDGTKAPAISSSDFYVLGNALPTWYGGFNNNLRYGHFDFNFTFNYSGGNYIQNGTRATLLDSRYYNNSVEVLTRWTTPGQKTAVPRQVYGDVVSSGNSFPISANVQKGDFVRLENVSLGYTLPVRNVFRNSGISSLRIYAAVYNAFVITGYKGYDPEISTNGDANTGQSIDRNTAPRTRNYTFGVSVRF